MLALQLRLGPCQAPLELPNLQLGLPELLNLAQQQHVVDGAGSGGWHCWVLGCRRHLLRLEPQLGHHTLELPLQLAQRVQLLGKLELCQLPCVALVRRLQACLLQGRISSTARAHAGAGGRHCLRLQLLL